MRSVRLHDCLQRWPGVALWALAWAAMLLLDGRLDLANLALLLLLGATAASLWLPPALAMIGCAASVLAFNWLFVPPRGSFSVNLHQHALLLGTMLVVGWVVAALVARQRALVRQAQRHAEQAGELRALGETLRDAETPQQAVPSLRKALERLCAGSVALLLLVDTMPGTDDDTATALVGDIDAEARAGLWLCLRNGTAFGPGTGHHQNLAAWYLPLRGREGACGAALLPLAPGADDAALRAHAQALCDQLGLALERARTQRHAAAAQQQARAESVRSTLLAAISHDYRTPLATIQGAASSLRDQADRLGPAQRKQLATAIVDEAERLARMTDNTLQLARLDASPQALQRDWESAEELVGTVMRRLRPRDPERRVRARVEPGLPLLHCDALLLVQLLDNLVDNALKYSDAPAPVEIVARRNGEQLVLAVRDRGPGVPHIGRERIFEVFQRGTSAPAPVQGAGVGLAVCRAIARAHGGELSMRTRAHGGSSFECSLPLSTVPAAVAAAP